MKQPRYSGLPGLCPDPPFCPKATTFKVEGEDEETAEPFFPKPLPLDFPFPFDLPLKEEKGVISS